MIVITGAAGHIGNVLILELLKQNRGPVRALVLPDEDTTSLDNLAVEHVQGNILDPETLMHAFTGADLVFHLASIVAISRGTERLVKKVNVEGTKNVIEACKHCGVKRLVYTSSIHAIKEPPQGTLITEECGFHPETESAIYEKTKAQASVEIQKAAKEGLDAVIVCPSGVIGPYDYRGSEMGELFIEFVNGKLKAYVPGAYDFVDVRDVACGHILAADKGQTGATYILSGEQITVKQIMEEVEKNTGINAPNFRMPLWMLKASLIFTPMYYKLTKTKPLFTKYSISTLQSNSLVSHEKAKTELGFNPRPIRESIRDHIQWLKDNGKLPSLNTK